MAAALPRIALITGAGGPMGRAVAHRLVAEGVAGLVLADISARRLAETEATLRALPAAPELVVHRADVTLKAEARGLSDAALMRFGRIDLLVNLVGGMRSEALYTPFLDMDETRWRQTFDLNLLGGFHLMQALVPGMIAQRFGRVVNVASIVFGGENGQSDYAAAKAAVASLTRSLAAEFAPHVTVNCVAPGLTNTSVTRNMPTEQTARLLAGSFIPRLAEPEETAAAIAFFLRDEAAFVTGEILAVSGGVHPHL